MKGGAGQRTALGPALVRAWEVLDAIEPRPCHCHCSLVRLGKSTNGDVILAPRPVDLGLEGPFLAALEQVDVAIAGGVARAQHELERAKHLDAWRLARPMRWVRHSQPAAFLWESFL